MSYETVACVRAAETGEVQMVYQIDHDDRRVTRIGELAYADDPEFDAFDGEIIAVCYPDGFVEV